MDQEVIHSNVLPHHEEVIVSTETSNTEQAQDYPAMPSDEVGRRQAAELIISMASSVQASYDSGLLSLPSAMPSESVETVSQSVDLPVIVSVVSGQDYPLDDNINFQFSSDSALPSTVVVTDSSNCENVQVIPDGSNTMVISENQQNVQVLPDGSNTVVISENQPMADEDDNAIIFETPGSSFLYGETSPEIHIVEDLQQGVADSYVETSEITTISTDNQAVISTSGYGDTASTSTMVISTSRASGSAPRTDEHTGDVVEEQIVLNIKGEPVEETESLLLINKKKLEEMGGEQVITIEPKKQGHECIICQQRFSQITALYRHRISHNENAGSMFKCSTCQVTFKEPLELEKHKQLHLDRRVFKCVICQEVYADLYNYKCHLRIHEKKAAYSCDICPFTVFSERKHYIAHLDDHDLLKTNFVPGRPLQLTCNMCGRAFSERYQLKRHQAYHHSEKCFKCSLCQRAFVERSKLNRHMLVHTGKREYVCPICDKTFALKHNLVAHMRIHANSRPWECGICRKTFIQKVCLQRHYKVHEGYTIEYEER